MRGTSAARHILLTCLRASTISVLILPRIGTKIIKSIENNVESLEKFEIKLRILDIGMSRLQQHPRIKPLRNFPGHLQQKTRSADRQWSGIHTKAFDFLMCCCRKRNCRFKLDRSIVSRSIFAIVSAMRREQGVCFGGMGWGSLGKNTMNISLKLWRQRVLRSSQPIPPAPTSRARMSLNLMALLRFPACAICEISGIYLFQRFGLGLRLLGTHVLKILRQFHESILTIKIMRPKSRLRLQLSQLIDQPDQMNQFRRIKRFRSYVGKFEVDSVLQGRFGWPRRLCNSTPPRPPIGIPFRSRTEWDTNLKLRKRGPNPSLPCSAPPSQY